MQLGEKIYALRARAGYSQENFAEALGVSRQSVSRWENDTAVPDTEYLVKMCRLLGVSLDALLLAEELPSTEETAPMSEDKPQKNGRPLIAKRCFLGVIAGVFFALGIYFIVDAVLAYGHASADPGDGPLAGWLFELTRRHSADELLFDLCDALWFFRFIPALAIFDLLFCMGGKRYSAGMFGVCIALCVLLAVSLLAQPLSAYAREVFIERSDAAGSDRAAIAAIGACKLAVLCAMTALSAVYIVLKRRYFRR